MSGFVHDGKGAAGRRDAGQKKARADGRGRGTRRVKSIGDGRFGTGAEYSGGRLSARPHPRADSVCPHGLSSCNGLFFADVIRIAVSFANCGQHTRTVGITSMHDAPVSLFAPPTTTPMHMHVHTYALAQVNGNAQYRSVGTIGASTFSSPYSITPVSHASTSAPGFSPGLLSSSSSS